MITNFDLRISILPGKVSGIMNLLSIFVNEIFRRFAIQTLLTSGVGVGRRFGVPRAFAVLSMSVGYDTRSMLREEPLLR